MKSSLIIKQVSTNKTIYILQPAFYNREGNKYLSGGAERYLTDLSEIIINLGYKPVILQRANKFWHLKHHEIDVIGVHSGGNDILFNRLSHSKIFGNPALRIYSPFTLCEPCAYKNSIGISHGIFWDNARYSFLIKSILKAAFKSRIIVSVDTNTINWLRATDPRNAAKRDLKYVVNYVNTSIFKPDNSNRSDQIIITYPRRIYGPRGYFLLEAVIPRLLSRHKNVEFHLVGQVEHATRNSVNKLISMFPKEVLVYEQRDDLMHEVYQKSDITLIPTVSSEGTSLSCLEAMATGNAVIATNVGGLPDLIIDKYNGLLISPNADELEQAIELLITDVNLRKELGKNALHMSKVFDKSVWQEKWRAILFNVI